MLNNESKEGLNEDWGKIKITVQDCNMHKQ